jgi:Holliday junction resolvase RusA-like endonuclease
MTINVKPMGKPRMTQRDKWAKRPVVMEYFAFKDSVLYQARDYVLPDEFRVTFGMPFPRSYGKGKRAELLGQPHQVKPDGDNLLKSLQDILSGEGGDSRIWHVEVRKIWTSGDGFILVEGFDERS